MAKTEFDAAYRAALDDGVMNAALTVLENAIPQLKSIANWRSATCVEFDGSDPKQPVLLLIVDGDSHRIQL